MKPSQHFTITRHLPNEARIEFSGIVYNHDPENYDIEDVLFHTHDRQGERVENITQWFHHFRDCTDPDFHHEDIYTLLQEWLRSNEARPRYSYLNEAA